MIFLARWSDPSILQKTAHIRSTMLYLEDYLESKFLKNCKHTLNCKHTFISIFIFTNHAVPAYLVRSKLLILTRFRSSISSVFEIWDGSFSVNKCSFDDVRLQKEKYFRSQLTDPYEILSLEIRAVPILFRKGVP